MRRKNLILGIGLIFLGIAIFLRNFNLFPRNSMTIMAGLIFLFLYFWKRQQVFLVLGLISIIPGLISLLKDFNIISFKVTGDVILMLVGLVFVTLYFRKKNIGFLLPGVILIAFGSYITFITYFNNVKLWPCFFIFLGIAFYSVYFIALYDEENWPLVIGTILCLFGISLLGVSYGALSIRMIRIYSYVWPLLLVLIGLLLIFKKLNRR